MSQSRAKKEVMITMTKIKPGGCPKKARHHGERRHEKKEEQAVGSKNSSNESSVNLAEMLKGLI